MLFRCLQADQDQRQISQGFSNKGEVESHQSLFRGDTIETNSDFTKIRSQGQVTQIRMFNKEC